MKSSQPHNIAEEMPDKYPHSSDLKTKISWIHGFNVEIALTNKNIFSRYYGNVLLSYH